MGEWNWGVRKGVMVMLVDWLWLKGNERDGEKQSTWRVGLRRHCRVIVCWNLKERSPSVRSYAYVTPPCLSFLFWGPPYLTDTFSSQNSLCFPLWYIHWVVICHHCIHGVSHLHPYISAIINGHTIAFFFLCNIEKYGYEWSELGPAHWRPGPHWFGGDPEAIYIEIERKKEKELSWNLQPQN